MADTYSHPQVTKAREIFEELAASSPFHPYIFQDPKVREAHAGLLLEQELIGDVYITHVELAFPPQVKEKYGKSVLIVDVYDILKWLVADPEQCGDDSTRETFLKIAEEFYAPDYYEDEDDNPEGDCGEAAAEGGNFPSVALAS